MAIQTSPVFKANWDSTADIVVNQGGTDSTKTYSILQVLGVIAVYTKPPLIDPIITVLSESVPNARKGAYRTWKGIVASTPEFENAVKDWNESDRVITFKSGWIFEFVGATDEQNAKQGKRQYLFANEANGISWLIFWQMAKRTRVRTFIDYNPSAPFWAHENLINKPEPSMNDLFAKVQLIISDHRHNPFLNAQDHEKTENIKDSGLWKVYARGITGNLTGLIFPNWTMIEDEVFANLSEDRKIGGLDFGYTNDPTAGVKVVRIAGNVYFHELCYETAFPPRQILDVYRSVGFKEKDQEPIYCEHDGDMIRQLRQLGLYTVPARKGPGSIKAGIMKLNEYNVFFTASSKNIDYERKRYMWLKDPDTGKSTNEPVDQFNHLMDACRYAVYTHFYHASD